MIQSDLPSFLLSDLKFCPTIRFKVLLPRMTYQKLTGQSDLITLPIRHLLPLLENILNV